MRARLSAGGPSTSQPSPARRQARAASSAKRAGSRSIAGRLTQSRARPTARASRAPKRVAAPRPPSPSAAQLGPADSRTVCGAVKGREGRR